MNKSNQIWRELEENIFLVLLFSHFWTIHLFA